MQQCWGITAQTQNFGFIVAPRPANCQSAICHSGVRLKYKLPMEA